MPLSDCIPIGNSAEFNSFLGEVPHELSEWVAFFQNNLEIRSNYEAKFGTANPPGTTPQEAFACAVAVLHETLVIEKFFEDGHWLAVGELSAEERTNIGRHLSFIAEGRLDDCDFDDENEMHHLDQIKLILLPYHQKLSHLSPEKRRSVIAEEERISAEQRAIFGEMLAALGEEGDHIDGDGDGEEDAFLVEGIVSAHRNSGTRPNSQNSN